jgi:hypothetical protein
MRKKPSLITTPSGGFFSFGVSLPEKLCSRRVEFVAIIADPAD